MREELETLRGELSCLVSEKEELSLLDFFPFLFPSFHWSTLALVLIPFFFFFFQDGGRNEKIPNGEF